MNRSLLVVCICCFSWCAAAAGELVTMGTQPIFTADDAALMGKLQQRADAYGKEQALPQRPQPAQHELAESAAAIRENLQHQVWNKLQGESGAVLGSADMNKARYDTLIFASFSLSEKTLKTMYQAAAGAERTAIVFRGLPPDCHTINAAIRRIQQLAADMQLEIPPNAVINPVWFKQYHITSVPSILVLERRTAARSGCQDSGQSGCQDSGQIAPVPKVTASVRGLLDPAWLHQRIAEGRSGDLGIQGPVAEIAERDLIEEMIARAEKIDWQAKKQQALSRVWTNLPITELRPALQWRKRLIDPTFTVNRDVTLPDGTFIAHQGERINPLDRRQFNRLLVVFDGSSQHEIAYVKAHLPAWQEKALLQGHNVRLIITGINRARGWDSYQSLTNYFDDEIFVLTPEVKQSFALEHHPCIVYADGRNFAVEEYAIDETD